MIVIHIIKQVLFFKLFVISLYSINLVFFNITKKSESVTDKKFNIFLFNLHL